MNLAKIAYREEEEKRNQSNLTFYGIPAEIRLFLAKNKDSSLFFLLPLSHPLSPHRSFVSDSKKQADLPMANFNESPSLNL